MVEPFPAVSRRQFLGRSAGQAAGLAAGLVGLSAAAECSRVHDPVRVGIVGVRRHGRRLAGEFAAMPGTEVVSLCDIDESVLAKAGRDLAAVGATPRLDADHRIVFADPRVDAVVIVTPDHSHATLAAEAMRAGKDVYLETPACHAIGEAADLLAVARETGRVVQTGLQDRSLPHVRSAIEFVRSGRLGAVPLVRAWAVQRRAEPAADAEAGRAPAGVDYARWLYPAAERPFDANRFHRNWNGFWEYGSGELGSRGVGLLDLARWGLGVGLPDRVSAAGGRLGGGPRETPDTLHVTYAYPGATVVWEHRQWSNHPPEGRSAGVAFHGERGTLVLDRGGWKVYDSAEPAGMDGKADLKPHLEDFLARVRDRGRCAAPLEVGLTSATLCHLGNIAYRLRREVRFDAARGDFPGDDEATALVRPADRFRVA